MALGELTVFGAKLERLLSPTSLGRVVDAGGMAGKRAALEAATQALGPDRAMSGMRRKAPLGAGYDRTGPTEVTVNFRPAGLWILASQGRRSSGVIRPRKRGAKALAGNGFGPRASSRYGPSRGTDAFDKAVRLARVDVPRAAHRQFVAEIAGNF